MKGKPLKLQVLDRLGKNHKKGSLTKRKLHANAKEFGNFLAKKFGLERIDYLKPKHIQAYVESLHARKLMPSTMADKMTAVRFVAEAIGKDNIVPKHNRDCGIRRERVNPQVVNNEGLDAIRQEITKKASEGDWRAQMIEAADGLRREFGLRAKEALLSHRTIMRNGHQYLIVEGAKGGRPRELEVRTTEQEAVIAKVEEVAEKFGSNTGRPIPPDKTLQQAYDAQRNMIHRLGGLREKGRNMHADRHQCARDMHSSGASSSEIMAHLGHGQSRSPSAYVGKKRGNQ